MKTIDASDIVWDGITEINSHHAIIYDRCSKCLGSGRIRIFWKFFRKCKHCNGWGTILIAEIQFDDND